MKQLIMILTLISLPAWSLTKQDRIDYSVLKMYDAQPAGETAVVPASNGYVISTSKLQNYVEVKDDAWNAEINNKPIESTSRLSRLKSFFTEFMQLKTYAKNAKDTGVSQEEINKLRLRRQTSIRLGQELKESLANYQNGSPLRIRALKTCSEALTEVDGSFDNRPFKVSLTSTNAAQPQQSTTLVANELKLEEREEFVQVGGFRLAGYQTTRSTLTAGKNLKQVSTKPVAARELLTGPLVSAWSLAKSLGGCCANKVCRESLRSTTASPTNGGLDSYGTQ
jgi:hypothetical protein